MPVVPISPDRPRLPAWFKRSLPDNAIAAETNAIVRSHGLVTVCEEATCPNRQECWSKKAALHSFHITRHAWLKATSTSTAWKTCLSAG
jgi:lipoate synthase